MSNIRVTIDRVALAGFDPAQRAALVAGLKDELSRVLASPMARAALTGSRRTPVVRLGKMPLTPGKSGSRQFGTSLARAIGRRLGP
ncbi:MAG: hypothetical protein WA510_27825 [Acidobacteriaceae bacterium]